MKKIKEKLIRSFAGYDFEELEEFLNNNKEPEVRDAIMIAMELYHEEQFKEWIEKQ